MKEKLVEIEEKFSQWVADLTHITDEEKDEVYSKIESARKWLSDNVDAQAEKKGHEDPVFTSEEVPEQTKPVQKLIAKLTRKPKPKPPKVEKNETEKNSTQEESSDKGDDESANTTETDDNAGSDDAKSEETSGSDDAKAEESPDSDEKEKTEFQHHQIMNNVSPEVHPTRLIVYLAA